MQALDKAMAAFEKGLAKSVGRHRSAGLGSDDDARRGVLRQGRGRQGDRAVREGAGGEAEARRRRRSGSARSHFSKGDVAKALELFQQVVASAPGTPEAAEAEVFIKELKKPQHHVAPSFQGWGPIRVARSLSGPRGSQVLKPSQEVAYASSTFIAGGDSHPRQCGSVRAGKRRRDETGPVRAGAELAAASTVCPAGHTWGSTGGIFAESPDRVFIFQRGCLPEIKSTRPRRADTSFRSATPRATTCRSATPRAIRAGSTSSTSSTKKAS